MGTVTNRYMCLACGVFFQGEKERTWGVDKCPNCKDIYYVDNVIEDIPPHIEDVKAWQIQRLEELGL